jgi:hypothetical protein
MTMVVDCCKRHHGTIRDKTPVILILDGRREDDNFETLILVS